MPRIARLWTDLELESSQFTVGLRKAVAESTAASGKIQKELSGIRTSLMAGAAAIAGIGLVSAARSALDFASSLGEVAQQLGVSTKDLQEYRYAATQVGISQETMDKGLAKLTRSMGDARNGSEAQSAAFRELNGLLGKDILASARTAGEAIPLVADALAKIEDPTKRARLEVALFGKAGQQLDTLLAGGSGAVNELRDAAQSLGIVLSDRQIQDADKTADKLSELNTVLSANIASAVAENAREIYGLVDSISSLIAKIPAGVRAIQNFRDNLAIAQAAARGLINPAMAGQAGSEIRNASARIRIRNAGARREDAVTRLERAGYIVPRNSDGSVNEAGIKRSSQRPAGGGAPTPAKNGGGNKQQKRGGGASAVDKAEKTRLWYEDQIARSKLEELSVQDQIIGSYRTRYAVAMARIEADKADFARDLAAQKGLTAAQKAELIAANDAVVDKQTQLAEREKFNGMQRETFDLFSAENDAAQESVRAQIDAARTVRDRRDGELRLLDLQKQAEAAQLELVLATESTASAAWQNARDRKDALDGVYATRAAGVKRDNLSPMARYLDTIPRTANEIGEAYEEIAVRGIGAMNDALGESIRRTIGLKGAVGDLISEIVLLQAKQMLFGGASGGGGIFGKALSLFGMAKGGGAGIMPGDQPVLWNMPKVDLPSGMPRLATGGTIGGFPGIDRNVLSINNRPVAMVSASERIHVTPDKLRPANDERPIVIQVAADEGAMFVPRVQELSRGESADQIGRAARAQGRARRRSLVR